ncbi:fumarylacetoacetate hydrolase family protein [Saccharopolyspora flava]|uniref:2-keto-4-pentenoate hydratase/2-oxohepta-3-ene-1,7-dioic acid hydratase (Catechol pathway) n=1 Tax=Saccharopolyspora flava TaxID=95161 RepID=A0A1I6UKL5_9PSEU|nr:fumarylacetoacetate hydrolase family protein [Saccharopolyspora flava]SFT02016.1 2-keto-4-pentenoate hydratase/2-oxohepta-3-ene-1,7-dioic acid hydratase (catechol pathway) [Saccharopolyspora flava]
MRFATARHDGTETSGVVDGETFHPLPAPILELLRSQRLPEAGAQAVTEPGVPLAEVELRAPLEPATVRDFVAFEEHVEGMTGGNVAAEWYAAPTFYFTNPYAITGPFDDVAIPPGCRRMDFELEVAAVIGRPGRDLTPEQAREHIIGYTIFNDWSARDLQSAEMKVGLGPAKGKDFATTLGPVLVTADELETHRDADGFLRLPMSVSVNGERIGHDLLSNMGWPFEELVSYASRGTEVRPGDVLGSGTCGNGGCLGELWGRPDREDPPPLRPGDVVEMTVEGIGTIRNRVTAGHDLPAVTPARTRPRDR